MRNALRTVYIGMPHKDFQALARRHDLRRDDEASFRSASMLSERYIYSPGWTAEATKQRDPSGHSFTIYVRNDRITDWLSTFPEK